MVGIEPEGSIEMPTRFAKTITIAQGYQLQMIVGSHNYWEVRVVLAIKIQKALRD